MSLIGLRRSFALRSAASKEAAKTRPTITLPGVPESRGPLLPHGRGAKTTTTAIRTAAKQSQDRRTMQDTILAVRSNGVVQAYPSPGNAWGDGSSR
jgi:hypothetical protein